MKLFKTLAICLLGFFAVSTTACNNSFCSEADKTAIQEKMLENFESGKFEGFSLTQEAWDKFVAEIPADKNILEVKKEKVDELYQKEHPKSCMTIGDTKDPLTGATIEGKSWGFAFGKNGGFIEGLLVYPIAVMLIWLTKVIPFSAGASAVVAIILGTFIIRTVISLLTFKSTMASQKMQILQPEMNAINAKYEGMNDTNSKNRKAMEMMALYKKYDIKPFSSMLAPFLTLPVFISIYGAVQSSTVLKEGSLFGVSLGQTLSSGILGFSWFAILLFILMIASQFLSMKIPTWVAAKKVRVKGNPNAQKNTTNSQMNMMTYIMLFMIVFVGWMLPIGMTVYWVTSSIFSIIQTLISQKIMAKKDSAMFVRGNK